MMPPDHYIAPEEIQRLFNPPVKVTTTGTSHTYAGAPPAARTEALLREVLDLLLARPPVCIGMWYPDATQPEWLRCGACGTVTDLAGISPEMRRVVQVLLSHLGHHHPPSTINR